MQFLMLIIIIDSSHYSSKWVYNFGDFFLHLVPTYKFSSTESISKSDLLDASLALALN